MADHPITACVYFEAEPTVTAEWWEHAIRQTGWNDMTLIGDNLIEVRGESVALLYVPLPIHSDPRGAACSRGGRGERGYATAISPR